MGMGVEDRMMDCLILLAPHGGRIIKGLRELIWSEGIMVEKLIRLYLTRINQDMRAT